MTNYNISRSAFSAVFTWFIMSFFFFITSCTRESDIIIPQTAYSNIMVEFNVSQKQEGSTRSQGNENSLNLDSEDYEDYVDKWNTHIHIVFSGDSVGRVGIKTELSTSFPHFVDNVM